MLLDDKLSDILKDYLNADTLKLVLSRPAKSAQYKRVTMRRLEKGYHIEKLTETQAFHENVEFENLLERVRAFLENDFSELNAWDSSYAYNLRITKKGKLLFGKKRNAQAPKIQQSHNREKRYILSENTVIPPLVDMGIMTSDGKIVKSMYGKYRQINRFVEMIADELEYAKTDSEFSVIDFGCGKSYLTFILYYYLTEIRDMKVKMLGLDLKDEVIKKCNEAAQKYGYENLRFETGDISGYEPGFTVDMVISLHACDTATDYALYNAVKWDCDYIFSVPCCHHEFAAGMTEAKLPLITKYGIVKERTAALITDAVRANLLKYCGYQVQLLEFIEMEHTPKNILIRAKRANIPQKVRNEALEEARQTCEAFGVTQTLYRLLKE